MDQQYFYSTPGGNANGPISLGILKMQLSGGKIPKNTIVCRNGDSEWFPLADIALEESLVKSDQSKAESPPQAMKASSVPVFQEPGIASALKILGMLGALGSVLAIFLAFLKGDVILGASGGASLISSLALVGVASAVNFAAEAVHLLKQRR